MRKPILQTAAVLTCCLLLLCSTPALADTAFIISNSFDIYCSNPVGQGETFRVWADIDGQAAYPYKVNFSTPFGSTSIPFKGYGKYQSFSTTFMVPENKATGNYTVSGSTKLTEALWSREYSDSTSFKVKRKGIDVNPVQTHVVAGETLRLSATVHGLMSADGWNRKQLYVDGPWGKVTLTNPSTSYGTYDDANTYTGVVTVPYETISGTYTVTFSGEVFRYAQQGWPYRWDTLSKSMTITVLKPPDVRELSTKVEDSFALSGLPLGISTETPSFRAHVEKLQVMSSWGIEAPMQTTDGVYFRGQLPILKNTKTGPMDVVVTADISQPPHYPTKKIEQTIEVFVKNTTANMDGSFEERARTSSSGHTTPDWWTPPWYQH